MPPNKLVTIRICTGGEVLNRDNYSEVTFNRFELPPRTFVMVQKFHRNDGISASSRRRFERAIKGKNVIIRDAFVAPSSVNILFEVLPCSPD